MIELSISLFPDLDGLDGLIEETVPWLEAWAALAALVLAAVVVRLVELQVRRARSPLAKLMRGRAR